MEGDQALNAFVKVGQHIPRTYARDRIHNTPGFDFYVSGHYALKCSRGDDFAREMLTLSEPAYPHTVTLAGGEPPDPAARMCLVCRAAGGCRASRGLFA